MMTLLCPGPLQLVFTGSFAQATANCVTNIVALNEHVIMTIMTSGETINCGLINQSLETNCKGTVHKNDPNILSGNNAADMGGLSHQIKSS